MVSLRVQLLVALLSVLSTISTTARASPVTRSLVLSCTYSKNLTSIPFNFTLAAVNITLPNLNNTGVPLVLGEAGAVDGAEFEIISTYATYPYDDFPSLYLSNTTMGAWNTEGYTYTNATGVTEGGSVNFYTSGLGGATPASAFSALSCPGNQHPIFAVHGRTDLWSLCPGNQGAYSQTQLIFNASAAVGQPYLAFDPADCYQVAVNVIRVRK